MFRKIYFPFYFQFFELETYPFLDGEMAVRKTSMGENKVYVIYAFWSKIILMEAIPYGVIFSLNVIIVTRIFESIRFRKRVCSNKQHKNPGNALNKTENTASQKSLLVSEKRRRSSPILNQITMANHNSKCFLSSSNLAGDTESRVQANDLSATSSGPIKVTKNMILQQIYFKQSFRKQI